MMADQMLGEALISPPLIPQARAVKCLIALVTKKLVVKNNVGVSQIPSQIHLSSLKLMGRVLHFTSGSAHNRT